MKKVDDQHQEFWGSPLSNESFFKGVKRFTLAKNM